MIPYDKDGLSITGRVPRMRGDDPRSGNCGGRSERVFPACAGMILVDQLFQILGPRVPRMRGDDPSHLGPRLEDGECSPHARG